MLVQCFSLFSIIVINSMTKSTWRGKSLFGLTLSDHSPSLRDAMEDVESKTEAESMKE